MDYRAFDMEVSPLFIAEAWNPPKKMCGMGVFVSIFYARVRETTMKEMLVMGP